MGCLFKVYKPSIQSHYENLRYKLDELKAERNIWETEISDVHSDYRSFCFSLQFCKRSEASINSRLEVFDKRIKYANIKIENLKPIIEGLEYQLNIMSSYTLTDFTLNIK